MKIYFAGELFSQKHLIGNAHLANAIQIQSSGLHECILPQALEPRDYNPKSIRDVDIEQVIKSDVILCNFDGTDVDTGTVVEYMIAKFLDIPAVILRTDFRKSGDSDGEVQWNLMMAYYPRTKIVLDNCIVSYQSELSKLIGRSSYIRNDITASTLAMENYLNSLAIKIVSSINKVVKEKPKMPADLQESIYNWMRIMYGSDKAITKKQMSSILESKIKKGLL